MAQPDAQPDNAVIALPVLATPAPRGKVARSRSGKWRALSLTVVHLLILAHVAHWLIAGRTVSPVEPSESMETLETGRVNAGIVFFAVSILATLVFGRFFCGWGCHFIAYQDLCTWLMNRLGIKPKPLRARLLIWVPLAVAFYMFAWPTLHRWLSGGSLPPWQNALMTSAFWRTFPGWIVGAATLLISGFCIVYFLGSKGFCTYACPYGAVYGLVEQVAPVGIRVNENCDRSSHCTVACNSNVDVAYEVATWGMVVNPGCMRCLDCVTVCPNDALYVGLGAPAAIRKRRTGATRQKSAADLAWPEEIALLALFGLAFFACRGLYGEFPLLMSLGLAGILAYLLFLAARLVYRPSVRLQSLWLKYDGRLRRGGVAVACLAPLALAFIVHAALWQLHTRAGNAAFFATNVGDEVFRTDFDPDRDLTPEVRRARDAGLAHFGWTLRWGMRETVEANMRIAWMHLLRRDAPAAERHVRAAIAGDPDEAALHFHLGRVLRLQQQNDEAVTTLREALRLDPHLVAARQALVALLLESGRLDDVLVLNRQAVELHPDDADAQYDLGNALSLAGDFSAAHDHLARAVALRPDHFAARYRLGVTLMQFTRIDDAIAQFQAVIALQPAMAEAHYNLGLAEAMRGRLPDAAARLREAARLAPDDSQTHALLARVLVELGLSDEAELHMREVQRLSRPTSAPSAEDR